MEVVLASSRMGRGSGKRTVSKRILVRIRNWSKAPLVAVPYLIEPALPMASHSWVFPSLPLHLPPTSTMEAMTSIGRTATGYLARKAKGSFFSDVF
jgi:hypothetical protein